MKLRWLAAGSVLLLAAVAGPAAAQVTQDDLAEAEERLGELREEIDAVSEHWATAVANSAALGDEIATLQNQVASRRAELDELRQRVSERLVDLYIDMSSAGASAIFGSGSPDEVDARSRYLADAGGFDRALINNLEITASLLDAESVRLEEARVAQDAAAAELEIVAADVLERLEAAQSEYNRLLAAWQEQERRRIAEEEARRRAAEEEARRRAEEEAARNATTTTTTADGGGGATDTTAPPTTAPTTTTTAPASSGGSGMACPIDGFTSFTDTWGAPRSGGRFHQGVDMLSARGTPVVSVAAGHVKKMGNGGLGGITVWITADNGDEFYYAHLDSWAAGLSTGQSVVAGSPLGTVGTTGNAPAHIPHLHWEYHPGGGGAVNPTPLANDLCG